MHDRRVYCYKCMLIQDYMLNMDTQLWFAKDSAELKQDFYTESWECK